MAAWVIAHVGCPGSNCPTTYDTGEGTNIVQGGRVTAERAAQLGIDPPPADEILVEVPTALLDNHAARA